METKTIWNGDLHFTAEIENFRVDMDAKPPLSRGLAASPKQLLLASISGCTAMDVASLLKKHKQKVEHFEVGASASLTTGDHPKIFQSVELEFRLKGEIDPGKAVEAVELSMTKYCGVSAMVSRSVPIHYVVSINDQEVGRGEAKFFND